MALKELHWAKAIPELANLSDDVSAILDDCTHSATYSKGARLFGPEQPVQSLFLLVSGKIRIQRRLGDGTEMPLGVVCAGEGCALTTACQLSFANRAEEALAETDIDVFVVPQRAFDALMHVSRAFRAYVFEACAKHIADLSVVIEDTVARRIDIQLAEKLAELSEPPVLDSAQHWLSLELGTEPGVISKHLNEFERRRWIALGRGLIELADMTAIRQLAMNGQSFTSNMIKGALT